MVNGAISLFPMDRDRGHPLLTLITSSSPARPVSTSPSPSSHSHSPFRYVHLHSHPPPPSIPDANQSPPLHDETDLARPSTRTASHYHHRNHSLHPPPSSRPHPPLTGRPSPFLPQTAPNFLSAHPRTLPSPYARPRGLRISRLLRSWLPIILYALTSLSFVVAIACFRTELFTGEPISPSSPWPCLTRDRFSSQALDYLSSWLRSDEQFGYAVLFFLIFLTTFRTHSRFLVAPSLIRKNHSSSSSLLDANHPLRIHIRSMDGCRYFLFGSLVRSADRIRPLACPSPRHHLTLAGFHPRHQARRSRDREASQASLPHPSRTLSIQRHELSPRSCPDAHAPHLHALHRTLALQGHRPHQPRRIDPLLSRLPHRRPTRRAWR